LKNIQYNFYGKMIVVGIFIIIGLWIWPTPKEIYKFFQK
jgi:hypothetical protein